jgi:hypothetical protein
MGQGSKDALHPVWLKPLPWFACTIGLLAQFHSMVLSGFRQMHGGLGDARLVNFTLEHGYRWLRQIPPHEDFWRPPIFYPYPNASAFTDTMLGFGPPYWLPRLLGAAPDTALQWWTLIVYGLNFAAAYVWLRKGARLAIPASSAGALLLAMISVAWTGHLQLFPFFYVMLALLALFRIFDVGETAPTTAARRAWIGVFLSCCVLQVWGAVYAFFFFGLLAAIAVVVALALPSTRSTFARSVRRDAGIWILAVVLSAAAAAPLVLRYGMTVEETGYRKYSELDIARPYSWIIMGPHDRMLGRLQRPEGPLPSRPLSHGLGLLTFCVAAAGLVAHRRRASVLVIGIATLVMMLLATMYWGFSPWRLIHEIVPGAGGIRAQFRVTMTLIPAGVLGVGLACDGALRLRRWWLALLLVAICVAERAHTRRTIDKRFVREHVVAIAERVDPDCEAFLLVGTGRDASFVSDDAAWVAMATGKPAINGRYGNFPKGHEIRHHEVFDKDDHVARNRLEAALGKWLDVWGIDRGEVQWIEYEGLTDERTQPYRRR